MVFATSGSLDHWWRMPPLAPQLELDTWIMMHEDLRSSQGCRISLDALAERLGCYVL